VHISVPVSVHVQIHDPQHGVLRRLIEIERELIAARRRVAAVLRELLKR